ncbi:YheC/YheD family protein [Paenibacillus sp. YPG26]|uniref:YheC/YheD family protein n=1 Tax=Paenibacillus sp. YPG26 TaxID=2878915 RepID=UPI00203C288C|nr:YheC/YheD family protein [Paenibacillus sp. YPG26]USB33539.1 YheC/YheD family protein [Paenibacillus sp. YPG26]
MSTTRRRVRSKLLKHRILLSSRRLARHLPAIRPYSPRALLQMLHRYGMVYVKPDNGSMGVGVIRVEARKGYYTFHQGTRPVTCRSFRELAVRLGRIIRRKRYLIQKGIHVLRHKGRPYDFRVMIQRRPDRVWEPTGIAGRLAHPRRAVTNGSQGGTIYDPIDLLRRPAGKRRAKRLLRRMDRMALLTSAKMARRYPFMNELGLDIAVDRKLKPWILEVNTRPDPCPFTLLPDQSLIRRIIAYGRAYGRSYPLNCGKARSAR